MRTISCSSVAPILDEKLQRVEKVLRKRMPAYFINKKTKLKRMTTEIAIRNFLRPERMLLPDDRKEKKLSYLSRSI